MIEIDVNSQGNQEQMLPSFCEIFEICRLNGNFPKIDANGADEGFQRNRRTTIVESQIN